MGILFGNRKSDKGTDEKTLFKRVGLCQLPANLVFLNREKSDFDHPKNKWKVVHSEADDFAGYKGHRSMNNRFYYKML